MVTPRSPNRPRVSSCPACPHERLHHDSWGCTHKCNCNVSIASLTRNLFSSQVDRERDQKAVEEARQLVAEAQFAERMRLKMLYQRAVEAQAATTVA